LDASEPVPGQKRYATIVYQRATERSAVKGRSSGALYRRSRQRSRILELLQGTDRHPTANWLYGRLRREFPGLSMGTVYRNLGILAEQGLIKRIGFGSTFDRFDANTRDHYHLICESCGAIIDLDLPIDQSLNERVSRASHHRVLRHDIQFRGTCEKCASRGAG
jgi:Fur family peroxide stress response transcriptional regulator